MKHFLWNDPASLRRLLCELVSWNSQTLTEGEKQFPFKLKKKLELLRYFKKHPEDLSLYPIGDSRHLLTALYHHPRAEDTVVLISHFDTVPAEEYGDLEPLAFYPEKLTRELKKRKGDLPEEARVDLESGEYLFGRGTMDMKMGLALHMALIEKATVEEWPVNLLLASVPDEEVNSAGMRAAVKKLVRLKETRGLSYKLMLNSEPSFSQKPGDERHYIYSGTIGKIMPAALVYGKETHVGEPLKGMTANYIASFLTQSMEWNPLFSEKQRGEETPLPVSLLQKDLKTQYSTQTPYRAAALYNVFLMNRSASDIMNLFEKVAKEAAETCNRAYEEICDRMNVSGVGKVQVIRYEELFAYAEEKMGSGQLKKLIDTVLQNDQWDDRDKSLHITEKIMIECPELAPAIILLFAPPFYPAVNTSNHPLIVDSIQILKKAAKEFGVNLTQVHYFNGICDLSYVHHREEHDGWTAFEKNTPVWGKTYEIPFADMRKLQAPVLNVGPYGKDAHQKTERLHMESAFVHLPAMLEKLVKSLFSPFKEEENEKVLL